MSGAELSGEGSQLCSVLPHHRAEIKEQGYMYLKLRVVALNDLNGKCPLSLRVGTFGCRTRGGDCVGDSDAP